MHNAMTICKRNGVAILVSCDYGNSHENTTLYQYPKGHPCHGCSYILQSDMPACMFPKRTDGGCFWHDLKFNKKQNPPQKTSQQEAADRISEFIKILENVKNRKGS